MRKIYKYLIVFGACVVLLLCSVISVGATTTFNDYFMSNSSNVVSVEFTANVDPDTSEGGSLVSGSVTAMGKTPKEAFAFNLACNDTSVSNVSQVKLTIKPKSGFLKDLKFYEDCSLSFILGQRSANSSAISNLERVRVRLIDSNGRFSQANAYCPSYVVDDCQYTTVTFKPEYIKNLCDVSEIWLSFVYENPVPSSTAGVVVYSYATVEFGDYTNEYFTDGWTSNPEIPDNAEDVGELGSIEEELQQGSQEGIDAGMDMITGLGDSLTGFQKGFAFFMSFSDELLGNVTWISSVLTIGLALGIVAFLLNIVGSVSSKISRDERRAEADKRREESQARREKQNKR